MNALTKALAALGVALTLSGCVLNQAQLDRRGQDALGRYVGKPISAATAVLGMPDDEQPMLGGYMLRWFRVSGQWHCTITLYTDANYVVTAWAYLGNNCEHMGV